MARVLILLDDLAARISDALAARPAAGPRDLGASAPARGREAGFVVGAEAALRAMFGRPVRVRGTPAASPAAAAPPAETAGAEDLRDKISAGSRPPSRPPVDIDALAGLARTRDYFQVLGVARGATSLEIREAAAHLLAELDAHRLRMPGPAPDLEDVRQVVLDARDVLANERLRALYLEGIAP